MVGKMVGAVLPHESASSGQGKKHENHARHLQPESVKSAAEGKDQGLAPGKDGIEKLVFLYNALHGVFESGNFRHLPYCSPKIGVFLRKNKTLVTPRASNLGIQRSLW